MTAQQPICRSCEAELRVTFCDLGTSPLSNSYLTPQQMRAMEPFYPLHAYVCERCLLVQVEAFETSEHIFSDYAYFSSYSNTWLEHSRAFAELAMERLGLDSNSLVAEAASNDGYLLQYFQSRGARVIGIEPARNVAAVAVERGIPTESVFLGASSGASLRDQYGAAQLVIANNVIAHVPDLHDFFAGLEALMAPAGTLTVEFPQVQRLIEGVEFDTIYHEHFSYYSFYALERVLERHALHAIDVEELATHGGSLRVWIARKGDTRSASPRVEGQREQERRFGIERLETYSTFSEKAAARKREVLRFLIDARERGLRVAGYGAPAKGNTLLNYCGIRTDLIAYTVDRNPHKQGMFLPGSRIPVLAPEHYLQDRPDLIFILPWNLKDEIIAQQAIAREWGARFVVAMPALQVL